MKFPLIHHICCLALLCGCVDSAVDPDFQFSTTDREPKQPTYTLSVSPTEIEVASADVTESLRITADGNWQIRRDADWINFYPSSGNGSANVTIDIKENKTAVTRSSSITIVCTDNGETVRLQVTQRGKSLTLSAYQIDFSSEGGTRNINYETDGTLFVRNDNDWISCEVSDTQLKITTTGNSSQSSRTAVVYASPVKIDDISNCTAITITQAGVTEDSGHSEIERDDFGNDQDWDDSGQAGSDATYTPYLYFIGSTDGWSQAIQRLAHQGDGLYNGFCYVADPYGIGLSFKFMKESGDWSTEVDASYFTTTVDVWGSGNLEVGQTGVYYMEANLSRKSLKCILVETMGIVGSFNNWTDDYVMTWDADNYCYVKSGVNFTNEEWKFRVNYDWTYNLGGSTGNLYFNGDNITASGTTVKLYPCRIENNNIYYITE